MPRTQDAGEGLLAAETPPAASEPVFAVTWGVPMLCMHPCQRKGGPSELPFPCSWGPPSQRGGAASPAPLLRAAGAWQELGWGGAGGDGSMLLSPAEITQKVIVSRGKGGRAEAV